MEIVPFEPRLPTPLEVGLPTPFPGLGLVSGSGSGLGLGLVRSLGREEDEDNESFSKLFLINNQSYTFEFRYFPTGFSPSGNFTRVFSQVATSQMCNFPSGNFPSLS